MSGVLERPSLERLVCGDGSHGGWAPGCSRARSPRLRPWLAARFGPDLDA